jgi:hypothetical protein
MSIATVNQIIEQRQLNGKVEVLLQWAVSWASVEEMAGQSVSQIMGTRVRPDGVAEFLVNWSCSWATVDEELMQGDLWQPFLNQEAKDEADQTTPRPREAEGTKSTQATTPMPKAKDEADQTTPRPREAEGTKSTQATKRKSDDVADGRRRSLRKQGPPL